MDSLLSREISIDFPDLKIGTAEYKDGPTGCTVFLTPPGSIAAIDVRGGAAAVRESTLLTSASDSSYVDAIVLTGGSTYGLDSASGVMQHFLEERKNRTGFMDIPCVPAAVVYDFGGRKNSLFPDSALGKQAASVAKNGSISIGQVGAGANVRVGKFLGREFGERGGQGVAFQFENGVRMLAVTILNSYGHIVDRNGTVIAGSYDRNQAKHLSLGEGFGFSPPPEKGNTTISAFFTDADLDRNQLERLAIMVHTSMARVIEPFHSPWDGDVLFAVSTRKVKIPDVQAVFQFNVRASLLMQKAVLSPFSDA